MADLRTPTPRQLERALEKTVPSEEFSAAGTSKELEQTEVPDTPGLTPQQFLRKTVSDPEATPTGNETTMLPGFSTTSAVPPELLEDTSESGKRFEMDGLLGRGGNASVYAVRDHSLGRRIALKLLRGKRAARPGVQRRFIHEARVTAMLEHPNIVPVYDIGVTEQGCVYFLMKNVTGMTVGDAIRALRACRETPAGFDTIDGRIRILLKVCDAMAFAHDKGFVHRDLKPDNIILGDYGEVLVLDWGCALGERQRREGGAASFGTPAYMAPEQARQGPADQRSDIYCLGATLYQMVTLHHPTWDDNPERFWELKRAGELTPLPPEVEAALPSALLAIARTAMAPDPAGRYQTVAELSEALVGYQSHAESIALTQRALDGLQGAIRAADYHAFAAITARLEQALEMWAGNDDARAGMHTAKRAHALCAIDKGDLALAESVIAGVPGCEAITDAITAERARRALRQRRARRTIQGAAALAVILLCLFGYYVVDYFRYFGKWQLLYSEDFTQAGADTTGLAFSSYHVTRDGPPLPIGPRGIELDANNMFWLRDVRERGDVRLEVRVRWQDLVDGVELMINSRREQGESFSYCPTGYSCQFGGWTGTINAISRNDRPQVFSASNAVEAALEPNHVYRLWFQRVGEELSMFVDGRKVFSTIEPVPLAGEGLDRIAVRSWSPARILSVSVWRLGSAAKTSPLVAGDVLVEEGMSELAVNRYVRIAHDHRGTRIAEQALVRAYLVSVSARQPDSIRQAIRETLSRDHDRSRYWSLLLEADCRQALATGQYEQALSLAREALDRDPQSRVALHVLAGLPRKYTVPDVAQEALKLVARTSRLASLNADRLGITDLSALRGLQLRALDCSENEISSLEPLAGMPLRRLGLRRNRVTSLQPLRGMPLEDLEISDNQISDLTPLEGMPLTRLNMDYNPTASLGPLAGMPLVTVSVSNTQITSLEPLRGMMLQFLNISQTAVADLRPLAGMPLRKLVAESSRVHSLEGLQDLPLRDLSIQACLVETLEPIRDAPLEILNIDFCPIDDLSTLHGKPLRELNASFTDVASLEPLTGLPLNRLNVAHTSVRDLLPVRGMPLRELVLTGTQVRDLSPLEGMELSMLHAHGTPLASLQPFETIPPTEFLFDSVSTSWTATRALLKRWEARGDTATARLARTLHAARSGDIEALQSCAVELDGHKYVWLPYLTRWPQADSIARAFGGHLLTVTSPEEERLVLGLMHDGSGSWLALHEDSSGCHWNTGEPFQYSDYAYLYMPPVQYGHYLLRHHAVSRHWFRSDQPTYRTGVVVEWEPE